MKLIYLIAGTYRPAGMEKVLAGKANWLVSHGHEVVIVTTEQHNRESAFELDKRIRCIDLAIGYEDNNGKSFLNKALHYPFKQISHRRKLTALLMKEKADIVVSMFCNDVSFLPKIEDGSKKVLEIHFSRYKRLQYGRKGLFGVADRYLSKKDWKAAARFDRFVVLTEEDRELWGDIPGICVIPNARPFKLDSPAPLNGKLVVAIGRYNPQKGFDRLIEAWELLPKELLQEGWKLRLVGDGELREELGIQINKARLQDSIILGKAESNMKSVYKEASILAMSSRYEGLPMVLIEAQSSGVPAVSFSCKCGPKDVITDGVDGLLVPEGDVSALAKALEKLMRDENLRKQMGAAAYKASERFEENAIMAKWIDLFENVIRR